jgi:hypothetical protein
MRSAPPTFWLARAASGALALSLLLPWYSVRRSPALGPRTVDGWQAFTHADVAIVGVAVVALLVPCFLPRSPARAVEVACGLAGLAVVGWSLVHLPAIPPAVTAGHAPADFVRAHAPQAGPYVALVAAAVLTVSAGAGAIARPVGRSWPSETALVAGLVGLAAILRFSTLGVQSYWYDELATVQVLQPHVGDAVRAYEHTESTPPLYYAIAWLWSRTFGTGEFGLRSLSAAFGTTAVPVAYLAGRRLVSGRAGLFAAALVAVNPALLWYSQEARAFSLLVLLGAASLLTFARALRDPSRRNLALWAAAGALALLTHYFAVFLVAAEAVVLIGASVRRRPGVLVPVGVVAGVGLALLPLAHAQGGGSRTAWIAGIPLGQRVSAITKELISANTLVIDQDTGLPGGALGAVAAAVLTGAVAWAAITLVRRRRGGRAALPAALGLAALLVPLILTQTRYDYLLDRNLLAAWVPLAIALGAALAVLPRRAAVAAVAVVCGAGMVTDIQVATRPALQRSDWRHGVSLLGAHRGGRAVIVIPTYARGMLPEYHQPAVPLPDLGIVTDEVDVLGSYDAAGPYPRIAGFQPVERRQLQQIGLIRLRARQPIAITPAAAGAQGVDPAAIMAQYSAPARRWLGDYVVQLLAWHEAMHRLDESAGHGAVDAGAVHRLARAAATARRTFLPAPADIPRAASLARLIVAADDRAAEWANSLVAAPARARAGARAFDVALARVPGSAQVVGHTTATAITRKLLVRRPGR